MLFPCLTWSHPLKTLPITSHCLSPLLRASLPGRLFPLSPFRFLPPFLISAFRLLGGVKWIAKEVFEPRFEPQVRISSPPAVSPRTSISGVRAPRSWRGEMGGPQGCIRSSQNYHKVTKIQRQFPGPLVLLHYKHGSSQMVGHSILVISLILASRRHFSSFFPQNTPESAQSNIRPDVCKGSHQPFTINCKFLTNSFVQVMQRLE